MKTVKKGDQILVSVDLEFDGEVFNHSIMVENQFIPTINNKRLNFPIIADGDPLQVDAKFIGAVGGVLKKFEITINGIKGFESKDVKFKQEGIVYIGSLPYKQFDMKEV